MAKEEANQRVCSFRSGHSHPSRKSDGCQFEGAPVYQARDRAFCIFHLPLDAEIKPHSLALEGFGFNGAKRTWKTEENEDFSRYLKTLTSGARLAVRDLTGVVFPSDHFFRETSITNGLIGECTFHRRSGSFAFIGTQFTGDHVSFQHSQFTAPARFTDAQFAIGAASFAHARFDAAADFSGCLFPVKGTSFAQVIFAGDAVFRNAALRQLADFREAEFAAAADFSECGLPRGARFRGAQFRGPASFAGGSETSIEAKGGHAGEAAYDFSDAAFSNTVSFARRSFGSRLDLGTAAFKLTPDFEGSTFLNGVVFPPAENFASRKAPGDSQRYAVLKQVAAGLGSGVDREKFWLLEQASGRDNRLDPLEGLARAVYARCGLYGSSVTRPVTWLVTLTLIAFPVIYVLIFLVTSPRPATASLVDGLLFSFEQTFQPFGAWRDAMLVSRAAPFEAELVGMLLALVASLQSIAVLALLVMAIVAIRRRLRMT